MSRQPRSSKRENSGRTQRVPMGVPRSKMSVTGREGYVRRWINDVPGRLQKAEEAGYQFVTEQAHVGGDVESNDSDLGEKVSMIVGSNEAGQPLRAYLMEIPREYYDEDQLEKQKQVDATDNAIRRGQFGQNQEGRYIPSEGIKIS